MVFPNSDKLMKVERSSNHDRDTNYVEPEEDRLKEMIASMKNWLSNIPDCVKVERNYTDLEVFERVNVWLESIPDDWKENKSRNNIQIKSENYGNCDYYDEDFFAVDELATEPGDDFVSLENIKDERRLYNLLPVEDDGMEDLEVKVEVETAESVRGDGEVVKVADKPILDALVKKEISGSSVKCFMCETDSFSNKDDCTEHQKIVHGFKIKHFPCNICEFVSQRLDGLKTHLKKHGNVNIDYPCRFCDFVASRQHHLNQHMRADHQQVNPYTNHSCPLCEFRSNEVGQFQHHQKTVHGFSTGYYPCSQCAYAPHCLRDLRKHFNNVHRKMKHPCEECDKVFCAESGLRKHIRACHLKVTYKCTSCDFVCTRPDALKTHIDAKHRGIRHYCDQCPFSTTNSGNLTQHMKVVHSKGPKGSLAKGKSSDYRFHCDVCVFSCANKNYLIRHIETQHKGKVFKCDQCEFSSKYYNSVKIHVKSFHENVKYKCNNCDQIFNRQTNLIRHNEEATKRHPGKIFTCEYCGITSCLTLKRHMTKEHSGKSFPCDECEKTFTTVNSLKTHQKNKHRIGRVECLECGGSFASRESLRKHKKSFHSNTDNVDEAVL